MDELKEKFDNLIELSKELEQYRNIEKINYTKFGSHLVTMKNQISEIEELIQEADKEATA